MVMTHGAWLGLAIYAVVAISFSLHILAQRRDPAVMLAWILSFFLFPYLAALLYFFFGYHRFRRGRRAKPHPKASGPGLRQDDPALHVPKDVQSEVRNTAHLAQALTGFPVTPGNRADRFVQPQEAYDALARAIEQAQHHVHAEFYIVGDDAVGRRFADLLIAAAKRGVHCRLLFDAVGSWRLPYAYVLALRRAGVRAEYFTYHRRLRRLWHLHLRNHRKLCVIDGRLGFIGSQNLWDTRGGARSNALLWSDAMVRVEGPVAAQLQSIFLEDWRFATHESITEAAYFPSIPGTGAIPIQALPTGPDLPEKSLPLIFLGMLHTAQQRITVITPYLVPSSSMALALEGAARRGVAVSILLPKQVDNFLAQWAGRSWYGQLLRAGVRLFEHPDSAVHAKVTIIDEHLSLVGSANMDVRSFQLNFEAGVLLYGAETARQLQTQADAAIAAAAEIHLDAVRHHHWVSHVLQGAARLLSPLL